MYFQSAGVIKSAISEDGLSFVDEAGTRIDKTNSVDLTFDNVAAPTIMQDEDDRFVMVYRGLLTSAMPKILQTQQPSYLCGQLLMTV